MDKAFDRPQRPDGGFQGRGGYNQQPGGYQSAGGYGGGYSRGGYGQDGYGGQGGGYGGNGGGYGGAGGYGGGYGMCLDAVLVLAIPKRKRCSTNTITGGGANAGYGGGGGKTASQFSVPLFSMSILTVSQAGATTRVPVPRATNASAKDTPVTFDNYHCARNDLLDCFLHRK